MQCQYDHVFERGGCGLLDSGASSTWLACDAGLGLEQEKMEGMVHLVERDAYESKSRVQGLASKTMEEAAAMVEVKIKWS